MCDNLFNPDPYKQQGGDMVRVGGMTYTCNPTAPKDRRITNMTLNGKPARLARNTRLPDGHRLLKV